MLGTQGIDKGIKKRIPRGSLNTVFGDIQALVWVLSTSRRRHVFDHTSHESRVQVEHHISLDVCHLEYLKTSRLRQYYSMNTFHTSRESRVPVARFEHSMSDRTTR